MLISPETEQMHFGTPLSTPVNSIKLCNCHLLHTLGGKHHAFFLMLSFGSYLSTKLAYFVGDLYNLRLMRSHSLNMITLQTM